MCHRTLKYSLEAAKKGPSNICEFLTFIGVKIIDATLTGPESTSDKISALDGIKIDYVIDNWSKGELNASFAVDIAKAGEAKQIVFISSAVSMI